MYMKGKEIVEQRCLHVVLSLEKLIGVVSIDLEVDEESVEDKISYSTIQEEVDDVNDDWRLIRYNNPVEEKNQIEYDIQLKT